MDPNLLILMPAVLGAAALQSATGVGFGALAGPILILSLNNSSAIQISIILNLLIALLLTPALWRQVDGPALRYLLLGILLGSPLGLLIFLQIDIVLLKLLAGIAVLLTLMLVIHGARTAVPDTVRDSKRIEKTGAGLVAGVMGVCLAMPGPVPAAWMAARGYSKESIRATILAMFIVAYLAALALQASIVGVGTDTLRQSAMLAPATILGIVAGHLLVDRISEKVFRLLLAGVLAITATMLFVSLA